MTTLEDCNLLAWPEKLAFLATQNPQWIVVAISGVTNSGKTTLASKLKSTLQSDSMVQVINQDVYFRSEDDPTHVWIDLVPPRKHQNWERLECINWNGMCQDIAQALTKPVPDNKKGFLLLDGHIILNYRPIATICQEKFFIDLDKETILSRRIHRNYVPPDPEGYFDQWVWPMYLSNREALKEQSSITYIDGSQSIEDMFDLVYRKLRSCQ